MRKLREADAGHVGWATSFVTKALRLIYIIITGATEEQLILRAMSLVYTTLLSIVPLLAVSFSVLKAFGVHTRFMIFLYYFLEPLGQAGVDIAMNIIGFVENVKAGVLGSIGLSLLIYTAISTIQKIEIALNYIWNIRDTRGFSQRFSNYLSVLLVGPVLIVSALGITASLMSSTVMQKLMTFQVVGGVVYVITRLAPYILITAAFTLIYIFLPNTRVQFRAALTGGVVAAILWETIGWIFTSFIASSAKYSAIYSGFATLILLLIWLYWNYLTLLIGARVSFFVQHPQLMDAGSRSLTLSDRLKEKTALAIMYLVGRDFEAGGKQWNVASLTKRLGLPAAFVLEVLNVLEEKGLLVPAQGELPVYLPVKGLDAISLDEIIRSVRVAGEDTKGSGKASVSIPAVDGIMMHIESTITASLEGKTLRDFVAAEDKTFQ